MSPLTLKKSHIDIEKITYYFTFIRGIVFTYDFDLHDGGSTPYAKNEAEYQKEWCAKHTKDNGEFL
jgi:hypothetical protein